MKDVSEEKEGSAPKEEGGISEEGGWRRKEDKDPTITTLAGFADIPYEIQAIIIDQVDVKTLVGRFQLVCKSWQQEAIRRLSLLKDESIQSCQLDSSSSSMEFEWSQRKSSSHHAGFSIREGISVNIKAVKQIPTNARPAPKKRRGDDFGFDQKIRTWPSSQMFRRVPTVSKGKRYFKVPLSLSSLPPPPLPLSPSSLSPLPFPSPLLFLPSSPFFFSPLSLPLPLTIPPMQQHQPRLQELLRFLVLVSAKDSEVTQLETYDRLAYDTGEDETWSDDFFFCVDKNDHPQQQQRKDREWAIILPGQLNPSTKALQVTLKYYEYTSC